jgi:acetyl esterase
MPLDPQVKMVLDAMASSNLPELDSVPLDVGREFRASQRRMMPAGPPTTTRDVHIDAGGRRIFARVYGPENAPPALPVLLWFHGGGFVIGSVEESDADCRVLCREIGCVVVSVEYRLAPESKFPGGFDDCYAATAWVAEHAAELGGDPARVAVGGDSAGGNLAAAVCLAARDRSGPRLVFQVLVYPVTDLVSFDTPSYRENAEGYYLTQSSMHWFRDHYLATPSDREHPYVSVLRAPDLGGLPPALVITAEYDPLRDEGDAYAVRLRDAGNVVTSKSYRGMIHGFFTMHPYLDGGKAAVKDIAATLKPALARSN